jgi:hypothetical protein
MVQKKTVCCDLDGVLAEYNGWQGVEKIGAPIPGSQEFTRKLSLVSDVVIFTTRCNPEQNPNYEPAFLRETVRRWLDLNGFHYHSIYMGRGKPIAAAYVDDRSVPCNPDPSQPSEAVCVFHRSLMKCCQLLHNVFPSTGEAPSTTSPK